ncbi:MAG: TetR/AcrR family transcriptional regulator [Pikeienuella sp.]
MADEVQAERRARIEAAAYELLIEKGYKSTSMLAVARRAKASNETMYRWYGDKVGLFRSLVAVNADRVSQALSAIEDGPPLDRLRALGPVLLAMVLSERAVALNRAAAADMAVDGSLGAAIAEMGRDVVAPQIVQIILQAQAAGALRKGHPRDVAEDFIALLVGDQQIRRVIGALPELSEADVVVRADRAFDNFLSLWEG